MRFAALVLSNVIMNSSRKNELEEKSLKSNKNSCSGERKNVFKIGTEKYRVSLKSNHFV